MEIAVVVAAQPEFRRDVGRGAKLDDDQRSWNFPPRANGVTRINREFARTITRKNLRMPNSLRDHLVLGDTFKRGGWAVSLRSNAKIHRLDGGLRRRITESPFMRRVKIIDEPWR